MASSSVIVTHRPVARLPAVTSALATMALLLAACRSDEREIRQHLRASGLHQLDVASVPDSPGSYRYTARYAGDWCEGTVSIERRGASTLINDVVECAPRKEDCTAANPKTCTRLGLGQENTKAGRARAAHFFRLACRGGGAVGCNALGIELADGVGLPQDLKAAEVAFRRSCDGGHARGCFNLAVCHHQGRGVSTDLSVASTYYERACARGLASGCYNFAVCQRDGLGGKKAPNVALRAFATACRLGHSLACVNLGVMKTIGDGVPVDLPGARRVFGRACQAGLEEGCQGLRALPPS